jgi:hypothetical protein
MHPFYEVLEYLQLEIKRVEMLGFDFSKRTHFLSTVGHQGQSPYLRTLSMETKTSKR